MISYFIDIEKNYNNNHKDLQNVEVNTGKHSKIIKMKT